MTTPTLRFDAVAEARPGRKWAERWARSWPEYEAWFTSRGGDAGPDRAACEAALARHMPELAPLHRRLTMLAGGSDRAARFLSGWRPPRYLGGCSIAARADAGEVRLVRNYDLSPDLNEGLLLRSEWSGSSVMGMVEFLWGLSDGVNARGLAVALAYGGSPETVPGFGVTHILRYLLETCGDVEAALAVLARVPSHMAYNVTLADRDGATATAELRPGGGLTLIRPAIAANHQADAPAPARASITRTYERGAHMAQLLRGDIAPGELAQAFLLPPLRQTDYAGGFGTLFTAEYDPARGGLALRWPDQVWEQRLDRFEEGRRDIVYGDAPAPADPVEALANLRPWLSPEGAAALDEWRATAQGGAPDWAALSRVFTR